MKIEEFDKKLREILDSEDNKLPQMKNKDLILENIQSQIVRTRKLHKTKIYYSLASVACLLIFATLFTLRQKDDEQKDSSVIREKIELVDNNSDAGKIDDTARETLVTNEPLKVDETKNIQPPKRKKAKNTKKAEKNPVVNIEQNPQENDEYVYIIVVEDN